MPKHEPAVTPTGVHGGVFDHMRGHVLGAVVAALEQNGVLELFATCGVRAADLGANGFLAEATLRYLAQRGLVRAEGEVHHFTDVGRELYDNRGYLVWLSGGYGTALHTYADLLTGKRQFADDVERDVRWVAIGTALVSRPFVLPYVRQLLDEIEFERVADIGCGNGHFLVDLCRTAGKAGIGIDISPAACAEAAREVTKAGLEDRIEIIEADAIHPDVIPGLEGVQLVVTFFFLHEVYEHGRDALVGYLEGMRRRLPAGAHLLTAEACPPEQDQDTREPLTPEYALTQAFMAQHLLPESEWRQVFEDAGFDVARIVRTDLPGGRVILARNPGTAG
jgi:SAM-dependent methyltransferase